MNLNILNKKIKELAKTYGREADELKKNEEFKKYVSSSIETEKAVKFIVDNAKFKVTVKSKITAL